MDTQDTALAQDTVKNEAPLSIKQVGYAILRQHELTQAEASQVLGVSRARGSQIERKLDGRYDITSPTFARLAARVVKNCMTGKVWGSIDKIKDSTALAASSMYYDRAQPAVRRIEQLTATVTLTVDQLVEFKERYGR